MVSMRRCSRPCVAILACCILRNVVSFTDVEFEPGKLGLTLADRQNGIVGDVASNGKAIQNGVEVDMKIVAVNGHAYTYASFLDCIDPKVSGEKLCKLSFASQAEWAIEGDDPIAWLFSTSDDNDYRRKAPLVDVTELFEGADKMLVTGKKGLSTVIKCCCLPGKEMCKLANATDRNVGGFQDFLISVGALDGKGCLSLVGKGWHSYHKYASHCLVPAPDAQILSDHAVPRYEETCEAFESIPELEINVSTIRNLTYSAYRLGDLTFCRNRSLIPYIKITFGDASAQTKAVLASDTDAEYHEEVLLPVSQETISNTTKFEEEKLSISVFDTRGDSKCSWQDLFGDSLIGKATEYLSKSRVEDAEPVSFRSILWRDNKEHGILSMSVRLRYDGKICKQEINKGKKPGGSRAQFDTPIAHYTPATEKECKTMKERGVTVEMLHSSIATAAKHDLRDLKRIMDDCARFQLDVIPGGSSLLGA